MTRRNGLVDVLDAVIATGADVSGDAVIQLAGVDLIRLDLRLLLAGIEEDLAGGDGGGDGGDRGGGSGDDRHRAALDQWRRPPPERDRGVVLPRPAGAAPGEASGGAPGAPRLDDGVGRLIVAVVELVRQLLERQAVRRMRAGSLDERQLERLGDALQQLERRVQEPRDTFGVRSPEVDRALGGLDGILATPPTVHTAGDGGQDRRRER